MEEVRVGNTKLYADMFPTFLYADQVVDKDDLLKGFCQGELLVCVGLSRYSCQDVLVDFARHSFSVGERSSRALLRP